MRTKERMQRMLLVGYDGSDPALHRTLLDQLEPATGDLAALLRLDCTLSAIENTIPADPRMVDYIREINPDIFCVTPMLKHHYGQFDLVKAVKVCGVPIIFLSASWDNFTTKGTVHILPDYTLVWNDVQRQEAITFHGLPAESIRTVGAARFDEFWEREIEVPRNSFCADLGFDPQHPIITYLGSSNLITADERPFVQRWINALRTSPDAASANILLRPHPKFAAGWVETFKDQAQVSVSVSRGSE